MKRTEAEWRDLVVALVRESDLWPTNSEDVEHYNRTLARFIGEDSPEFADFAIHFNSPIWGHDATLRVNGKKEVEVCWGSTNRTVSMAVAVTDLYRRVCVLGAHIEALTQATKFVDAPKKKTA